MIEYIIAVNTAYTDATLDSSRLPHTHSPTPAALKQGSLEAVSCKG